MMVFGGAAETESLRGYLKVLTRIHWFIVFGLFSSLALSAGVAHVWKPGSTLPGALAGVVIAGPCVLLFWLYRRTFYLDISVAKAAFGALFYCSSRRGILCLTVARALIRFQRVCDHGRRRAGHKRGSYRQLESVLKHGSSEPGARDTWRKHWRYGKWAIASSVAGWVPAYVYYPLLGTFGGLTQTAELRALMNLVQPLAQFYAALSAVFLPYAARQRARDPREGW